MKITVTPPFWQTWWYRGIAIIAVSLLIFMVYQIRTRSIRERAKRLEGRVEERTSELKTANKELQQEIVERKRLEQEAHRWAAQAALIYKIGQHLSSELKLEALLSETVTSVRNAFDYYGVMMLLLDKKGKCLKMQSIAGGYVKIFPKDLSLAIGEGMMGYAAKTGKTQVSGDVSKDPHYVRKANEETKSELAVPIKSSKKVIGVLDVQSDRFNVFNDPDVAAMEALSTQIATAIENARLYEQAQREIGERKRAEKALTIEKVYLEQLFENAPEAIIMIDNEGGFLRVNSEFTRLFGYKTEEVLGQSVDDLLATKDAHDEAVSITQRVVKGEKAALETVRQRKDGTLIHVSILASPIVVGKEQVAAYGIYRDITNRVQAERKQVQLLKEVESANQELKDFAYVVSHDLKAPLRAIGSLVDWMSTDYGDKFDGEGREMLNLLTGRVKRMNGLIDGVLQYSRVGRIKEKKVKVDLNQLMGEVIDMVAPPENITVEIENKLPSIRCERTRVEQIFQNLVSNAVKYMDKEKGEIKIGCTSENGYWKFSVSDNGPGIEEKYFSKIFQVFQTLVPRDELESTGVGLALVKKIVEMYGGKIWVESKVGSGCKFIFTLPE